MSDEVEPRRVIYEVCRWGANNTERRFRFNRNQEDEDDDDNLWISVGEDGVVIIASVTMFEHETYDPPPWIVHGIQNKGWWIRKRKAPATGLSTHGAVNWRKIADALAKASRARKKPTKGEQAALQDYDIALAEVALAGLPADKDET
jgi:hypothetical protein